MNRITLIFAILCLMLAGCSSGGGGGDGIGYTEYDFWMPAGAG